MTRHIPIQDVVRAEMAGQTVFKNIVTTSWDEAKTLGERLDQALSEVGGWGLLVGRGVNGGTTTFELYPKRSANKAWRIVVDGKSR